MVLHLQNEDKLLEMTKENANWKTVNIQGIKNESDFPDIKTEKPNQPRRYELVEVKGTEITRTQNFKYIKYKCSKRIHVVFLKISIFLTISLS